MGSRSRFVVALVCVLLLSSCSKKSNLSIGSSGGNVNDDALAISVDAISFEESVLGTPSTARSFILSNTGSSDIRFLQAPYITGAESSFSLNLGFNGSAAGRACGLTLPAGTTCNVGIQFTPARAVNYSERLIFSYRFNGKQFTRDLPVTGIGKLPPSGDALVVSPSANGSVNFNFSRLLPEFVKSVELTLTNPNSLEALTLVDTTIATGTHFRLRTSSDPCALAIEARGSCKIAIDFSSPVPVNASDRLLIRYSFTSGSVRVVELTLQGEVSAPTREKMHRFAKDGRYRHSLESQIGAIQSEGWQDLGPKFEVFTEPAKDSIPIYIANDGPIYLSTSGTLQRGSMYPIGSGRPGAVIHHLKSLEGEHVYTTADALKAKLVSHGWSALPAFGIAAAAVAGDDIAITELPTDPVETPDPQPPQLVAFARWFNPVAKKHYHGIASVAPPGNGWELEGNVGQIFTDRADGTVPWYHLRIASSNIHYLTTNAAERDALIAGGGWSLYRVEGYIYATQPTGVANSKIFHLYNPDNGDRIYTVDAAKKDFLVLRGYLLQDSGWMPGNVMTGFSDPARIPPSEPQTDMYRVGYPNAQGVITAHLFTASQSEYNAVQQPDNGSNGGGGTGEGAHFRVFVSQQPDTVPVYRVNIPSTRISHLTTNAAEKDYLVSIGWSVFPVAQGYMYPSASRGGYKIEYLYNPSTSDRIYTSNQALIDILLPLGWRREGVLGWAPVP